MSGRPSWEQYALGLAIAAAARSEDLNYKVGAVVLRPDNSVAGVGFNGAPSGVTLDWADRDGRRPFVIHAEMNALRYCSRMEVSGGLVAVTHSPCTHCLPMIAAYGIERVVYAYELDEAVHSLDERTSIASGLGIEVVRLST